MRASGSRIPIPAASVALALLHPQLVIELLFAGSAPITTIASKDSTRRQETASGCFITGIPNTDGLVRIEKNIYLAAQ